MKRVAVICGGRSSEHEISCLSGYSIFNAIDRSAYEPILIGITKSGRWVMIPEGFTFEIKNGVLPHVPENAPQIVADIHGLSCQGKPLEIDIAFAYLHGPYGEDGSIQGFFETANIPFVGSGILASAVAMDKSFAKPIFASHGIAVADGFVVKSGEWQRDRNRICARIEMMGFPLFVKPARGGSSRGTHKVKSAAEIEAAIDDALLYDSKAMVEVAISGVEVECAVLEIDGEPRASLVGQVVIDPRFEFYDFESKYLDSATRVDVPAPLPEGIAREIQEKAIAAFKALGCSGLARVDFFLTDQGEIVINELNTNPGFTATSVFPKLFKASGVEYSEIIHQLLNNALLRRNGVLGN